ncbi:MAG: helix-turn-helix transcriptional regulator [Clostridia bacterium]|nr:helix-turn-helix transcriptional regulator [Clostridia bacterium]
MMTSSGTKLELLRREAGMTQEEVAEYLGISRNTLAAYESGKSKIPLSVFIRLADLYKCDVFDVLGVHAPQIEFDIPEIELVKAHAKYKVMQERRKDDAYAKSYLPDKYYVERYKTYLKEGMAYHRIKTKRNT